MSATSVTILIAGIDRTTEVRKGSITIRDILDETPNTCAFTIIGTTQTGAFEPNAFEDAAFNCEVSVTADSGTFEPAAFEDAAFDTTQGAFVVIAPVEDADVRITLGDGTILFGGQIDIVEEFYEGQRRTNRAWHVECTDYSRLANRRKVRTRYLLQSASTIAADLVTRFTTGFTTTAIQAGLPAIAIEFTDETVTGALTRIADRIGGYCYIDYNKDVHLFITETTAAPDPITEAGASTSKARALRAIADVQQRRTRVYVEGGGSLARRAVAAGETSIPVVDASWYSGSGGVIVSGPQRMTYSGKGVAGGPVALTASPLLVVGNLGPGPYSYKYTQVSSGSEGPLSPVSNTPSAASMTVAAPSSAPTVTPAGESVVPPPASMTVAPTGGVSPPPGVITVAQGTPGTSPVTNPGFGYGVTSGTGGSLAPGYYFYAVGFGTAIGETEFQTTHNPRVDVPNNALTLDLPVSPDGRVTRRELYRTRALEATEVAGVSRVDYHRLATIANNTTSSYVDTTATASGPNPPATNTTGTSGPGSLTEGATYRWRVTFVTATGETTGSTEQNLTLAPTVRSANLSNIQVSGNPAVTARKIYRTLANGSQYFLEQTIANNTATTATSSSADSALGAAIPTTNTSGTGSLTIGAIYRYRVTYLTATGETTGSPEQTVSLTDGARSVALSTIPTSADGRVTARKVYRTLANGAAFFLDTTIANNTATTLTSSKADTALGAAMPTTNTTGSGALVTGAFYRYKVTYVTAQGETITGPEGSATLTSGAASATLSTIPVSTDARVTQRKIYRTVANGSQFLYEQTIANNTATTATSTAADTALGAPEPTTTTAIGGCQMTLTGIATGSGVTARKIYRTIAGGTAYKLLVTIADNTTTTYTDNKADSSLGDPSSDEEISELIGIPASGAGSILYDIKAGDEVNLEVQRDDLTAQARVGIIEHKIQDNRLSIAEAQARGDADLALHAPTQRTFTYQTRDTKTRSGKTITVELAIPALTAALKIQDVTITEIDIAANLPPLFTVQSSSLLFSYDDMLRRTRLFPT